MLQFLYLFETMSYNLISMSCYLAYVYHPLCILICGKTAVKLLLLFSVGQTLLFVLGVSYF